MNEFIYNIDKPDGFVEKDFEVAMASMIEEEGFQKGDLIFVFMDDKELLEFNKDLLDHDYFTDIITIDQKIGDIVSGEIMISIDRITENANQLNTPFLAELYRVLLHGVLHIIGYNDKTEEEISVMRERENFYLSSLSF